MDKLKIYSERIGEGYYKINHSSGLTIYVMELEGFNGTSAMFGTKYGSINTVFKTKADPAPAPVRRDRPWPVPHHFSWLSRQAAGTNF